MSQHYKITLKPIGSFYFGGEDSFSAAKLNAVVNNDAKAQAYFKKRQGYFAKSEMFPQQTQLLGMVRKELLRHNKKLLYFKNFVCVPNEYYEQATNIVGTTKWEPKESLSLGGIKKLSPLYLQKDKEQKLFIPAPFDHKLRLEANGKGYINGRKGEAYKFVKCNGKAFGAKDNLCNDFIDSKEEVLKPDTIFTSFTQTHTQTLNYKEDDEEQLFKVKQYRLNKDYSFTFFLTLINSTYITENFTTTVELGGERSYFQMHLKRLEKCKEPKKEFDFLKNDHNRIVLLSDSYINASLLNECKVTLAKKVPLRTISHKGGFNKTTKTILLSKGSVFYPKDNESAKNIMEGIEKYKNYTTIGYNHYIDLTQGEENV